MYICMPRLRTAATRLLSSSTPHVRSRVLALVRKSARLTPAEIRFLRTTLGWSGRELAGESRPRTDRSGRIG